MRPVFSIVVPAFNSGAVIELLLRCLDAQTFPREQFECVIVDDGSRDGTSRLVQNHRSGINLRYLPHPKNLGRSQARNTACAHAEGDIFVFLDHDMLPAPDWLAAYNSTIQQNPELDVISGGRYHIHLGANPDKRPEVLAQKFGLSLDELFVTKIPEQFERLRTDAQLGMYPGYAMPKIEEQLPEVCQQYPKSLLCAYSFISSNVAMRRALFEKVGGFDTSMRRTEDTDLGVRLWEIGARFGCAPEAKAYHAYHAGQGDRNNSLLERQAFFYRHPYLLIILLNLWFAYHDQIDPAPASPTFDSLLTLLADESKLPDIDLRQEFYRIYRQPAWADCVCDRDLMAAHYCENSGIPRDEIERYLDQAIAQGIVTQRRDHRVYFDFDHTTNWLRKSTTYQRYELEHTRYNWIKDWIPAPRAGQVSGSAKFENHNVHLHRQPIALQCRGIYEIELPAEVLAGVPLKATLNIPLPTEHACQTDVKIVRCEPDTLLDFADPDRTMISNFPLERAIGVNGSISVRYEFECHLREHLLAENVGGSIQNINNARYLKPTYPAAQLPKAEALLKRILAGPAQDSYSIASTIYTWILNNRRYLQSFLTDYLVIETGFGPCVHLARLFVNLCRLMRIPAREQCGAMFGRVMRPDTPQRTVITGRTYNIVTHTWAEFYTPLHNWVPVEFSAADFTRHTLTATNVDDETLREQLIRGTEQYAGYYFGNLDPFRIYTGERASQVPTYPLIKSKMDQDALKMLLLQTRHRLLCDVSGAAEFGDLWASLETVREAPGSHTSGPPDASVTKAQAQTREPLQVETLLATRVSRAPRRMVITSIGSTGDVQPLLALAAELRDGGHEITFALPTNFQHRIQNLGFRYVGIGAGTVLDTWHELFARQAEIPNPVEQTRYFVERLVPCVPQMFQELRDACALGDVLIGPQFQLAARMVHDATGIPFVSVHFSPFGSKGGRAVREISARIINQCRWQAGLSALDDPLGVDGASPQLALYPVSQRIFRQPAVWPSHYHLTGYWFFDQENWQPAPELVEFLKAGEPPVVITFGSMPSTDPITQTTLILAAIEQAGCRAIIQHGGGGLARGTSLPENIHAVDFVPHGWLFPQAACVVHHGGAGTTAAAFRAGIPTVVVPHLLDQPIWAEYARAFACASAVIPYAQLTAELLSAGLVKALKDPRYRRASAKLGAQIQMENGQRVARELIENLIV